VKTATLNVLPTSKYQTVQLFEFMLIWTKTTCPCSKRKVDLTFLLMMSKKCAEEAGGEKGKSNGENAKRHSKSS